MNDHTSGDRRGDDAAERGTAGQALQPERAFVVQFRSGPLAGRRRLQGRVEHVVSGETLRFGSTAELLDFLTRLLDAPHPSTGSRPTPPRALEDRAAGKPSDAPRGDAATGAAHYKGKSEGSR